MFKRWTKSIWSTDKNRVRDYYRYWFICKGDYHGSWFICSLWFICDRVQVYIVRMSLIVSTHDHGREIMMMLSRERSGRTVGAQIHLSFLKYASYHPAHDSITRSLVALGWDFCQRSASWCFHTGVDAPYRHYLISFCSTGSFHCVSYKPGTGWAPGACV